MKALTTTVARIIYGIPFVVFGLMHFMKSGMMKGFVPGWVPGGVFWVYLIGLALIAAGVAIIIGKMVRLASLLLALLLLIFILTIHIPGSMDPDAMKSATAMTMLLKDMALMGGALLLAGIYESEGQTG